MEKDQLIDELHSKLRMEPRPSDPDQSLQDFADLLNIKVDLENQKKDYQQKSKALQDLSDSLLGMGDNEIIEVGNGKNIEYCKRIVFEDLTWVLLR